MKKFFVILGVLVFFFSTVSTLIAGGIDNKGNLSTEYIRTLNRNAATDSADAVAYNPAGVVKMEDGLFLNASGQYALKTYTNTIGGIEYASDVPSIVPSVFGLYKKDKWAGFAALTIPCGGGKVRYENGNATTFALGQGFIGGANAYLASQGLPPLYDTLRSQKLEADSVYYGFTMGGAYALNDMFSFSLGLRYIDAEKSAKGEVGIGASSGMAPDQAARIKYEETADGFGGIIGINFSPTKDLNIGLRYETKTSLDFETDVKRDDLGYFVDGSKARRDLPALLGLGAAYHIMPNLKVEASYVYYFNEDANWEGDEDNVDNGYDVGIAFEYGFTPKLRGSVGYLYTESGIEADYMSPEAPELDADSVAVGFAYSLDPALDLNFGASRTFYKDETTSTGMKLEKDVTLISFGIQCKFM